MNILIIEDDILVAEFTRRVLNKAGHHVTVANDGNNGYKKACRGVYDVIVLDLYLPGRDGIGLCSDLRRHQVSTPIVMLTSETQEHSKVAGLDAGADDYMVKPFSHAELAARLRAVTRRPAHIVQSKLQAGDLVLDPDERVVMKGNKAVKLSPKEYELIEFLMQNPSIALPRHLILNKVWHVYSQASSNRLEVHIRQLRIKLGELGEEQVIQTVRGIGYRIKC